MIRYACFCLFLFTGLHLSAFQENTELVYTARVHLEKAQEFMKVDRLDSALAHCEQAREKAPSYREVYIVTHKLYEALGTISTIKIENLKAGQKISLEDEELAYYLGEIYQKEKLLSEAIEAYSNAIDYSVASNGEEGFRYYYYMGRGASYLKSRVYDKGLADFTNALDIKPESVGALLNRGFCHYNSKDKEKACDDWRKASKLGSKAAGTYIGQHCF